MCTNMRYYKYLSKYDFNERGIPQYKHVLLKCGFCLECQRDKSLEWANRLILESQKYNDVCFLTLTYNVENCSNELNKRDYQLFLKRLRKSISPTKIYYFLSAEYGEKKGRPHYHMIIFNWKPTDLTPLYKTQAGEQLFTSRFLEEKWQKGFVSVGTLTFNSAFYCGKYMQKAAFSFNDENKRAPFIAMSTSITIGFNRQDFENENLSPVWYQNGFEKSVPNSLLRRAEKDGIDISGIKKQREDHIQRYIEQDRERALNEGRLNFLADKKKIIKKGLDNLKKV